MLGLASDGTLTPGMLLFVVVSLLCQALTLALSPGECQEALGQEVEHFCQLRNATVTFKSVKNSYVNVACDGTDITCEDLPSTLDLASGLSLPKLGLIDCPPRILRCMRQVLKASSVNGITLLRITEPLEGEDVEGLDGVTTLFLRYTAIQRSVPIAALRGLPALRQCRVNGGRIELTADAFVGAPPFVYLELSEDHLVSIPPNSFRGLAHLIDLNIWGNNVTNISAGAFRGLEKLQRLTLEVNKLMNIEPGTLAGLSSLKTLSLSYNALSSLEDGVLQDLGQIENLTLTRTFRIPTLGAQALSHLPSLKNVHLETNKIKILPENLFNGSKNITTIYLNHNQIEDIPSKVFQGLSKLKILNITNNSVKTLPKTVFYGLTDLEYLNMNYNSLESLPGELFAGLQRLKEVHLDHNYISTIASNAFSSVSYLETLTLAYNRLSSDGYADVPESLVSPFHLLEGLKTLDLTGNSIKVIYEDWRLGLLRKLKLLNLSINKFEHLMFDQDANASYFLSSDLVVDLRDNEIQHISLSPGPYRNDPEPNSRTTLLLDNNKFTCDCQMYGVILRIKGNILMANEPRLVLGNAICSNPPALAGVRIADISSSLLTCNVTEDKDPCTTFTRPALNDLLLNCTEFPSELPDTKNIELKNYFEKEPTITIKSKYPPLSLDNLNVHTLDLSGIGLSSIDFHPSKHLKVLNVSHNHITRIPSQFLKANVTLYVANNPLDCYCSNQGEISALKRYSYIHDAVCHDGRDIKQVDVIGLCKNQEAVIVGITSFVILAICVIITSVIIYVYFEEIIVYMISRGICKCCVKGKVAEKGKDYDVFISFAHEDLELVNDNLLPKLENDFGQKVCVHYRDWVVGELIPNQINASVERSRKTIIILSESFLESMWANQEFFAAHNLSLQENTSRIILILLNDKLSNHPKLSAEIKAYISTNTYLLWDDPNFSKKLSKALDRVSYRITWLDALKKKSPDSGEKKSFEGGLQVQLLNGQLVNLASQQV